MNTSRRVAHGALAGVGATVAMTGVLAVGRRLGGYPEQPPKRLVRRFARRAGMSARRQSPGVRAAWPLAHFGFGAAYGAGYALAVRRSSASRGIAAGLGLWASSYLGWVPALGLLPPPQRDDPARAVTTFAAHVVYGAVLGVIAKPGTDLTQELTPHRRGQGGGRLRSSLAELHGERRGGDQRLR
ncbi:DUF6789 family protein [Micromonospora sp. CPCC 205539]|uniref:DUF6789 family protein n=1 Tax=Micromonospora sp. CPCC 205539 TaxID=3122408 RepID=UPI002FF25A73